MMAREQSNAKTAALIDILYPGVKKHSPVIITSIKTYEKNN
jgi:hypothetical protein